MKQIALLPRVSVEVNGSQLDDRALAALAGVVVIGALGKPAICELRFTNPPGPLTAVDSLTAGTMFKVAVANQSPAIFEGQVTAVEHRHDADRGRSVVIRGYDLLHRLRKRQRARVLGSTSAAQLARELASDLGISVEAETDGPTLDRIIQHRQSDLELLVDTCAAAGLYPVIRNGVLRLLTFAGSGDPVDLALGRNLVEARLELNGDLVSNKVTAAGWHPLAGSPGHGEAGSARSGRKVSASVSTGELGGIDSRALLDETAFSGGQAEALAQAELDRRASTEVVFRGTAEGDARLQPGARVAVSGVADPFAGTYVLTEVVHRVDEAIGFTTELDTAPVEPRPRPHAAVVSPGMVTSVNDPDSRGRVQVTLPTYGDVQTGWMPVLGLGAGKGKGLVVLPDVGDEVLVLLAHESPDEGIVLGGLYGSGGPKDPGVVDGATRRFSLVTAGGSTIRIDDHDRSIRIEDPTGSYLELTPKKVTLHSEVDLDLTAPGRKVTIKAKSVDFENA